MYFIVHAAFVRTKLMMMMIIIEQNLKCWTAKQFYVKNRPKCQPKLVSLNPSWQKVQGTV